MIHESTSSTSESAVSATLPVPLRSVVTLELEPTVERLDPAEAVEHYLDTHSSLFVAVDDAWQGVKNSQSVFYTAQRDHMTASTQRMYGPNFKEKDYTRIESDARRLMGTCNYEAGQLYGSIAEQLHVLPPDEGHTLFVQTVQRYAAKKEGDLLRTYAPLSNAERNIAMRAGRAEIDLTATHTYAFFVQAHALQNVETFLQDQTVVLPFMERIGALADVPEHLQIYPGLLELLATHVKEEQQNNILRAAIERSIPPKSTYASDFLRAMMERAQASSEMNAVIQTFTIARNIATEKLSTEPDTFIELFAEHAENWIGELAAKLQAYIDTQIEQVCDGLENALHPFGRRGRLPARITQTNLVAPEKLHTQNAHATRMSRRPAPVKKVSIGTKDGDYEDITGKAEREPIAHFSVLKSLGSSSGRRFYLESVDTVEGLIAETNIASFIKEHSGDKTIEPMIIAALQSIIKNPQTIHTRQMTQMRYKCLGSLRKIRRFSADNFSEVPKGSVAQQTRILFDVREVDGNQTLVVRGAFLKQQLHASNDMP